jgi:hypothetical protein
MVRRHESLCQTWVQLQVGPSLEESHQIAGIVIPDVVDEIDTEIPSFSYS